MAATICEHIPTIAVVPISGTSQLAIEHSALYIAIFYQLRRPAGIVPGFRLYDFRHTFGSRSAMAGVDLATLKELMGHSSITTTLRYVHPTPEHKRKAMELLENFNLDQLFGGSGNLESLQKSLQ